MSENGFCPLLNYRRILSGKFPVLTRCRILSGQKHADKEDEYREDNEECPVKRILVECHPPAENRMNDRIRQAMYRYLPGMPRMESISAYTTVSGIGFCSCGGVAGSLSEACREDPPGQPFNRKKRTKNDGNLNRKKGYAIRSSSYFPAGAPFSWCRRTA